MEIMVTSAIEIIDGRNNPNTTPQRWLIYSVFIKWRSFTLNNNAQFHTPTEHAISKPKRNIGFDKK